MRKIRNALHHAPVTVVFNIALRTRHEDKVVVGVFYLYSLVVIDFVQIRTYANPTRIQVSNSNTLMKNYEDNFINFCQIPIP